MKRFPFLLILGDPPVGAKSGEDEYQNIPPTCVVVLITLCVDHELSNKLNVLCCTAGLFYSAADRLMNCSRWA